MLRVIINSFIALRVCIPPTLCSKLGWASSWNSKVLTFMSLIFVTLRPSPIYGVFIILVFELEFTYDHVRYWFHGALNSFGHPKLVWTQDGYGLPFFFFFFSIMQGNWFDHLKRMNTSSLSQFSVVALDIVQFSENFPLVIMLLANSLQHAWILIEQKNHLEYLMRKSE